MPFTYYILRYPLALAILIITHSIAIIIRPISPIIAWRILGVWSKLFMKIFQISVTIENENSDFTPETGGGGCIMVSLNQRSLLEVPLSFAYSSKPFWNIFNIEYVLIPFIGWAAFTFGLVIVRQWPRQAKKTLKKAISYLHKGIDFHISIEGRRSKDGTLSPYKKGPVVLAIQAGVAIVPIVCHGFGECLPYGEWKIRPGKVKIKMLKAISTKGLTYEDRNMLVSRLRKLAEHEIALEKSKNANNPKVKESRIKFAV